MGHIKADETLDLILISAKPIPVKNESASNMLNGNWFIQTIGDESEKLQIKVICNYSTVKILQNYADTKAVLEVGFLDFVKEGSIIGDVYYDFIAPGTDPKCEVDFELAVIPDV